MHEWAQLTGISASYLLLNNKRLNNVYALNIKIIKF